jgi:hypothetical protein
MDLAVFVLWIGIRNCPLLRFLSRKPNSHESKSAAGLIRAMILPTSLSVVPTSDGTTSSTLSVNLVRFKLAGKWNACGLSPWS